MSAASERYVPAAGRAWLTGSYDRTVALTMRENAWRPALVQAIAGDTPHGGTVVEVGCGTGSLTLALATARCDATVLGVDADPTILALARGKPGADAVTWMQGRADSFALPAASADVVVCSLLLHHLGDEAKARALAHIAGLLSRTGVLHIADWGPPRAPAGALGARALQLFDGRSGPQSLLDGQLSAMLATAGLTASRRHGALRTVWGKVELWRSTLRDAARN